MNNSHARQIPRNQTRRFNIDGMAMNSTLFGDRRKPVTRTVAPRSPANAPS